jgi:hypothetical protein
MGGILPSKTLNHLPEGIIRQKVKNGPNYTQGAFVY